MSSFQWLLLAHGALHAFAELLLQLLGEGVVGIELEGLLVVIHHVDVITLAVLGWVLYDAYHVEEAAQGADVREVGACHLLHLVDSLGGIAEQVVSLWGMGIHHGIVEALQSHLVLRQDAVGEHCLDALEFGDAVEDGLRLILLEFAERLADECLHGHLLGVDTNGNHQEECDGEHTRFKNLRCHTLCYF